MNQAILLAATLLLCAAPFVIIVSALAGRSAVAALTLRLGLSQQASTDFGHLCASSTATSAAVTGLSWVFFVLGGIAAASALQKREHDRATPMGKTAQKYTHASARDT